MTDDLSTTEPGPPGAPTNPPDPPASSALPPPPLWDILTFKAAGAVTLAVGLLDPYLSGGDRDFNFKVIGMGMVGLGGRELIVRVLDALGVRK